MERANVAVILQSRAALMDSLEALVSYIDCLRNVLCALDQEGFAFDFITPEMMTTSEMTETGGFQRHEEEYHAAVYPWPTIHTSYQWREMNLFVQEKGKAVFCGPPPCSLTSGERISEEDAKHIKELNVESAAQIISSLDTMEVPRMRNVSESIEPLVCSSAID
jgi:hypothetical protein